jgi:Phage tail lysozyme/Prophage tail length tape measure protein
VAETQKYQAQLAAVADAQSKGIITSNEAREALDRIYTSTKDTVKGLRDYEAVAADVDAANRKMINSQAAYNARTGVGGNPLYGAVKDARQAGLTSAVSDEYNKTRAALIPLVAETQKYQAQLLAVADAQSKGIISSTEAREALDRIRASTTAAALGMRDFEAVAADVAAANRMMINSQAAFNARTGVGGNPLSEAESLRREAELTDALGVEYEQLRGKLEPLYLLEKQYEAELLALDVAQQKTGASLEVLEAAKERARVSYVAQVDALNQTGKKHKELDDSIQKGTTSQGQMRFATQQLTVQMSQMFSGIATGQPILITMIQQLHQVFDVAVSTGTLGRSIAFLIQPLSLVVIGITAVTGAFVAAGVSAEGTMRRMNALRSELSLVTDDYARLAVEADNAAKHLAATTSLSTADARAGAGLVAATPGFQGTQQQIEDIVKAFNDLSIAQGKAKLDTEQLGRALKDPIGFLTSMDPLLKNVNSNMVETAKLMAAGGDKAGAFALALKAVQEAARNRAPQTLMQKAIEDLGIAFVQTGQSGQEAFNGIGAAASNMAAAMISAIAKGVQALRDLNEWAKKTGGPAMYGSFWPGGESGGALPAGMVPTTSYGGVFNRNDVAKQVHDYFRARGLPEESVAAIMAGGPGPESNFNPYAVNPAGNSYGLFQHTDPTPGRGRMTELFTATGTRRPETLPQLEFVWNELQTKFPDLLEILKRGGDPSALTQAFVKRFENPANAQAVAIQRAATVGQFYNKFGTGANIGVGTPEGGPTSGFGVGIANLPKDVIELSNKMASGTIAVKANEYAAALKSINEALVLDPKNAGYLQVQSELTKKIYDNIPAVDLQVRKIQQDIDAQSALTDAWGKGTDAAIIAANKNKAIAEAEAQFAPQDERRAAAIALLTAEYNKQTDAALHAEAAAATGTPQRNVEEFTRQLNAVNDLLAKDPTNVAWKQRQEQLTKSIYEAVPAFDAEVRAIEHGVDAANRQTDAWIKGTDAARITMNQNKAISEVEKIYGKDTDETRVRVALLTAEYQKQADALEKAEVAKAAGTPQRAGEEIERQLRLNRELLAADPTNKAFQQQQEMLTKALYDSVPALQGQVRAIDADINASKRLTDAWKEGVIAATNMADKNKAVADADKTYAPNTIEHANAVALLTEKYHQAALAADEAKNAQANNITKDQIAIVQLETATLGMNNDQRELLIQHMKNEQDVLRQTPNLLKEEHDERVKNLDMLAAQTQAYQTMQNSVNALANTFSQAFDTIGNSITQAFISGQGQAVNWRNVMVSVAQQVLQAFIKLAVINPLINSLLGTSQPTLGAAIAGLSGGGGTAGGASSGSGGSNLFSMASTGSSVLSGGSSLLQAFGYQGLGGQVNSLLGGPGTSLFAGTGLGGTGGIGSAITGFLNTGTGIGFTPTFSVAGAEQLLGTPAASLAGGAGGATIGSLLGGIGGGFALGSLSGGLIQGSMDKVGPAPMIGAGAGAIGGALIGSIIPGLGTVIGGIIGGLLGGSAGGFIGPKAPSTYSGTQIMVDDQGRLTVGLSSNQGTVSNKDATNDAVKALNDFTKATNIAVTSLGGLTQLGVGSGDDKAANLEAALPRLRFTSTDQTLADNIKDRSFATSQELQDAVNRILAMEKALKDFTAVVKDTDAAKEVDRWAARFGGLVDGVALSAADYAATLANIATFVTQTVPGLLGINTNIGSLEAGIKGLNDQFSAALVTAKDLGYKEAELTAARDIAIAKLRSDALAALASANEDLNTRFRTAQLSRGGASPQDAFVLQMDNFDIAASRQRKQLTDQLTATYGDAYLKTAGYAQEMALLEKALGEERVATVEAFNKKIVAAWAQLTTADEGFNVRITNAQATMAGTPEARRAAQIYAFDIQAAAERKTFSEQLVNTFGQAYATTQSYADQIALQERALGAERLAIVQDSNDAITQATQTASGNAAATITSLVAYTQGLQTSSSSPLNAQDQLALARSQFNAVAGASAAGDFGSLQQLQGFAQNFLNASRVVYGSGASYVSDFQRVLDTLNSVSQVSADTLTASVLQVETRTQTATLVQSLADLKAAVDSVTSQLRQNQSAPARIAA